MYKILSINGGGIRGLFSAVILDYIEKELNKSLGTVFDLIVGTSSGAVIGAGLVQGKSAESIKETLIKDRKEFFKPNLFSLGGLMCSKYNSYSRERIIKNLLCSSSKSCDYAFISYDIQNRLPIIFNSIEDKESFSYKLVTSFHLGDAVCASSAAPVYWKPYVLNDMLLVDGGYVACDPTNIAVKLALNHKVNSLKDIIIINVGVGISTRKYSVKKKSNILSWALPSMDILFNSQAQITKTFFLDEGMQYYSLDANLNNASDDIDNISKKNITELENTANLVLDYNSELIKNICKTKLC